MSKIRYLPALIAVSLVTLAAVGSATYGVSVHTVYDHPATWGLEKGIFTFNAPAGSSVWVTARDPYSGDTLVVDAQPVDPASGLSVVHIPYEVPNPTVYVVAPDGMILGGGDGHSGMGTHD